MRIVIDGRTLGWTGIGRYVHHLLLELERLDSETDYQVLLRDVDWRRWQPTTSNFTAVTANIEPYSAGEQLKLPALLRRLAPDLVHFPTFSSPLLYGGPSIVTIHDLTLIKFKNVRGTGFKTALYELKYWASRLVLWRIAQRARHIITVSEFVRTDLLQHFGAGRFRITPQKVTAIYEAADFTHLTPQRPPWLEADTPFVLYVGNYYPNKNIGRLLDAFAELIETEPRVQLILTGKSDYFQQRLQRHARGLGLEGRIVFAGFVPDTELAWLYAHARLYAFVSLSEGFGIPGLEAMAAGTPVLSSTATCLPEVYGDAALYCDPLNPSDIASKMQTLLRNEELRRSLIAAGRRQIEKYSWGRMAEQTLAIYKRALQGT